MYSREDGRGSEDYCVRLGVRSSPKVGIVGHKKIQNRRRKKIKSNFQQKESQLHEGKFSYFIEQNSSIYCCMLLHLVNMLVCTLDLCTARKSGKGIIKFFVWIFIFMSLIVLIMIQDLIRKRVELLSNYRHQTCFYWCLLSLKFKPRLKTGHKAEVSS